MLKRFLFVLCLLTFAAAHAQGELTVFTLQSKPPQELVPLLQPMVGKQGSVSAYGDKLIVRAPADRLEEIRWLVSELDRPPRRLTIEVRVDRHDYVRDQHIQGGARYDDGGGTSATIHWREAGTRGRGDIAQRVHTLDGRPARISVGQAVPVYDMQRSVGPYGTTNQHFGVRYRDVSSGFYVLPRLHGKDGVTLEIYQQAQAPAIQTGHFNQQQASSVLNGKIGEWIPLGEVDSRSRNADSGIGMSASTRRADSRQISVRVTAQD